jgi:hypothetical protein
LAFGVAFGVCKWSYGRIIDGLNESLAGKEKRLAAKDAITDE